MIVYYLPTTNKVIGFDGFNTPITSPDVISFAQSQSCLYDEFVGDSPNLKMLHLATFDPVTKTISIAK